MSVTTLLAISLGAILTNNFIFAQFLGICPFLGVSKKIDTAIGMGAAVTFVMGLASAFCYLINMVLVSLHLEFMQTVAYILVIAGLVQFVEMFLKKNIPTSTSVYPMPWQMPFTAEAPTPFLEAKPSARPRMMQFTTIRGINTPRELDRAGTNALSSRSTQVTKPAMTTM